eukprot:3352262-Pyramimonas_sp.AAC.1
MRRQSVAKAKNMNMKVRKFARSPRKCRITGLIERTGPQAAGTYGHQITCDVGEFRLQCRRRLGCTLASSKRGRCLATLLDLRAEGHDPECELPRDGLQLWLKTWLAEPSIRGP